MYLVAYLPVTLEGSSIWLILDKFHDVHPVKPPSRFLRVGLAASLPLSRLGDLGCRVL